MRQPLSEGQQTQMSGGVFGVLDVFGAFGEGALRFFGEGL